MIVVFRRVGFDFFKGTVFLGDLIGSFQIGAEIGTGLSLLHIVQNTGIAIRIVVKRLQHLGVEFHIIVADIIEILIEIAGGQIGELDDLVGAFARITATHPLHHGMTGVVVGINQRTALKSIQVTGGILIFIIGVSRNFAGNFPFGKKHGNRHLVKAGAVIPFIHVIIPRIAGFQIAEANADAPVPCVETVFLNEIIHHLLQLGSINDARGGNFRCRRGSLDSESLYPKGA